MKQLYFRGNTTLLSGVDCGRWIRRILASAAIALSILMTLHFDARVTSIGFPDAR